MIDAHCHLQDERLRNGIEEVVARAQSAGVRRIVCCGTKEKDWPEVLALKQKYPDYIVPSFGFHPWYLKERSREWVMVLEGFLKDTPSAVGEIGLDYSVDGLDENEQGGAFELQLEMARNYERPVSIHCRRAWEPLLKIIAKEGPLAQGGIVHSYSGPAELIPQFCKLGLSISFSGAVTNSGNKKGRKAFLNVPLEHLLLETDSPDIPPVGVDGLNEPSHLALILKSVASLINRPVEEVDRITSENADRIFGALR